MGLSGLFLTKEGPTLEIETQFLVLALNAECYSASISPKALSMYPRQDLNKIGPEVHTITSPIYRAEETALKEPLFDPYQLGLLLGQW